MLLEHHHIHFVNAGCQLANAISASAFAQLQRYFGPLPCHACRGRAQCDADQRVVAGLRRDGVDLSNPRLHVERLEPFSGERACDALTRIEWRLLTGPASQPCCVGSGKAILLRRSTLKRVKTPLMAAAKAAGNEAGEACEAFLSDPATGPLRGLDLLYLEEIVAEPLSLSQLGELLLQEMAARRPAGTIVLLSGAATATLAPESETASPPSPAVALVRRIGLVPVAGHPEVLYLPPA